MITSFYQAQASATSSSSPLTSSPCPVINNNINHSQASDKVCYYEPDPAKRKPISEYPPNLRNRIRRNYIQNRACQPRDFVFPKRDFGGIMRHFNPQWFKISCSQWLEYSIKQDATFCLCCYLFKNEVGGYGKKVGDAFTTDGFRGWNKALERFNSHVGNVGSVHNRCFNMMLDLMNQEQSILTSLDKQSEKIKSDHRVRLNASIDVIRYLLKEGIPFRGHDESVTSTRRGHFLDLLKWYADRKEDVKNVVLEKAPKNNTMTSPDIQKDIVNSCAKETVKAIIEDLNGDLFGILVDESKDVSHKEQMALVLRYVNKEGELIERFLGLVHVKDTSAHALQNEIYSLLLQHSLSSSLIRGQGYDGASNMQGNINGLKTLILKDNPSAHCIHCFAHQLQLTLVVVAKKHHDVNNFFDILANILNVVGGSYKRREMLRDDQAKKLDELLVLGEVHTGSGLNQELGLQRPGDTRWGSHFKTLRNFVSLISSIVHILGVLANEGSNYQEKALAKNLVEDIRSYEFVCILHLMLKLLAITYDLNMALQKKDQDIVSAMKLIDITKRQLQTMRESKWNSLIEDVSSFCDKNGIVIPKMDEKYALGKSKRKSSTVTYSHHLYV
uniref:Zinc finger MYM-type protein 1-like n=2 Tax=Nicotiana TaxID=4085 RepID=A0A1S3Z2U2_TOBAC|nr:PREDICTED: zinc finger MYM-type protein 1-like [Nicotiana sylvestris]XP_016458743.1 PREDICTED: zinc finger MYM-type protein 1-like [Nicotiana tabacum]XP_016458744.1 PREDICTED: zinc finger MYM-type protein 1-like [Nicotiana tabacum]